MAESSVTSKVKWWDVEPSDKAGLSQAITSRVTGIENWVMGARYQNALYARLATGRELPIMFGSWMQKRVGPTTTSFAKAPFELPTDNIVAGAIDTLMNRLSSRPWVTVTPDGDFDARTQAKVQESWFAKEFERSNFYADIYDLCRLDALIWGNAFDFVDVDLKRRKLRHRRVMRDEVLVDEIEAAKGKPTSIIISLSENRDDLLEEYDGSEAQEAIENAPSAFPGVYYPGSNLADMIQTYHCFKLPGPDGDHGRHTVATRDGILEDWEWKRDHFPLAKMTCFPQSLGYWGQGIPEVGWDYQLELNRLWATRHEAQRHGAIGTILARSDSHITTKQLSSSLQQRIIRYDTTPPQFIAPPSMNGEIPASMAEVKAAFRERIGISQGQAEGTVSPLTSGRARIVEEQTHDLRNVNIGKNAEQFVTYVADLMFEAAQEAGLTCETPEGTIDFSDKAMRPGGMRRTAFPISSLPSEPAGRQERIEKWYANGFISRAEKFRLEDVPDTERFVSLATAVQDELEWTLDKIVTEQRYYPPEVFDVVPDAEGNIANAMKTANARYHYEKRREAPPRVLRLLRDFMGALADLMANPSALPPEPAPTPVPAQAGVAGGVPAAPPVQVTPSQAAPGAVPPGPAPGMVS